MQPLCQNNFPIGTKKNEWIPKITPTAILASVLVIWLKTLQLAHLECRNNHISSSPPHNQETDLLARAVGDGRIWSVCGLASAFSAYFPPFHRKNTKKVKGSHTPTSVSSLYFHIFQKILKNLSHHNHCFCVFDRFMFMPASFFVHCVFMKQMQIRTISHTIEGQGWAQKMDKHFL